MTLSHRRPVVILLGDTETADATAALSTDAKTTDTTQGPGRKPRLRVSCSLADSLTNVEGFPTSCLPFVKFVAPDATHALGFPPKAESVVARNGSHKAE